MFRISNFGFTVPPMANPDRIPAPEIAKAFGIGKLTRHLFICAGPDCVAPEVGEPTWEYLKKRMKQLNIAGPDGPCFRTKCQCLRICTAGPIAVGLSGGDVVSERHARECGTDHPGTSDRGAGG